MDLSGAAGSEEAVSEGTGPEAVVSEEAGSAATEPGPEQIAAGRERWRAAYAKAAKTDRDTTTISGDETEPAYGPPDGAVVPGFERIGWPGEFPFTRGLYPTGYRGRPWTIRQFAGFGNAA